MTQGRAVLWLVLLAVAATAATENPPGQSATALRQAQGERASRSAGGTEPVPWVERMPTLRLDARTTSFRARMRHVQTGGDGWTSERDFEEIDARLKAFSGALTGQSAAARQPLDPAQLTSFLHPSFQGTPLRARQEILVREQAPSVYRLVPDTAHSVTAAAFPAEVNRYLEGGLVLQQAKLKIIAISSEEGEPRRARVRVWYDWVARTAENALQQQIGHWRMDWEKDADQGWQIVRLTAEPAFRSHTPRPFFADITREALGSGAAAEQLQHGLEYWTLHLDGSVPMSDEGYSGLAMADVDGNGWEDIYVAQPAGLPNRLFLNNGDGTFTEAAAAWGLDVLDDTSGALFFDYDNDGDPDLFLVGHNGPLLFRHNGRGAFELQDSARVGLVRAGQRFHNPMSVCAADYDRDGRLDVYLTSYQLQYDDKGLTTHPTPYHDAQNGPPNFFYRNNGDGTFTDATAATGLDQNNNRFSYACAWGDYNNDFYADLYVANDFGRNNLYRNNGDGTFTDVAAAAGVEDIGAGMSAAWEDYDNDGWLDLYVGNMWSSAGLRVTTQERFLPEVAPAVQAQFRRHAKGNSLFRNRGDGTFEEVTQEARVALGRWAWSSDFFDADCDGHEDLFVVNGFLTNESSQDL